MSCSFESMVRVLKSGKYKLIETRQQVKILYLDEVPYVWLFIPEIGHVLEFTYRLHVTDHKLAAGNYRLYDVKNDRRFSQHKHLELFVGEGQCQGYLLLTDLPTEKKRRSRIIATKELICSPC